MNTVGRTPDEGGVGRRVAPDAVVFLVALVASLGAGLETWATVTGELTPTWGWLAAVGVGLGTLLTVVAAVRALLGDQA